MSDLYSDSVDEIKRESHQDLFLIMFVATPRKDHEKFGDFGGAYASCWVNTDTLKEAEILALETIEKEKWIALKFQDWEIVNEETYTGSGDLSEEEAAEYKTCLAQAFEHGICLSFYCWSIDAEDRDIEP